MDDSHDLMARAGRLPLRFAQGVRPGIVAGLLMALVLMILSFGQGRSPVHPLATIAAVATNRWLVAGPWAALVGLGVHLFVSAVLGGLFARVVGRTGRVRQLGLGFFYGVYVWAAVQFIVLPVVAPWAAAGIGTMASFFLGHLSYGLMLSVLIPTRVDIDEPRPTSAA